MGFSLIYTPVLHYDDINGRPLVGGKLYTYRAGTSTPATTYRNKNGTELNENPILLNERGECVCFLDDGLKYKFVLKDALDNTIWEQDNVSIPAGGGGGGSSIQAELPLKVVNESLTNNGTGLTCTGENAWAEGYQTEASGYSAHAEGYQTKATGYYAHAEGYQTEASGYFAHTEGEFTKATYFGAHAEGRETEAEANYSHAEGAGTKAKSTASHAEGNNTTASGVYAHAEGDSTTASGSFSHAEGQFTVATTFATHAAGIGTKAENTATYAIGKYNQDTQAKFVIGSGTGDDARSDAFKVDASGDTWILIGGVLTNISSLLANI